jgi:NADH-quinone oxidoreductase subunit M
MPQLHFPWLELAIVSPLIGAMIAFSQQDGQRAMRIATFFSMLALLFSVGEWLDFYSLQTFEAHDHGDLLSWMVAHDVCVVDELSAPLLPIAALGYFVVIFSTLKTKIDRFSFGWTLVSEAILLATISCKTSWVFVGLLVISTIPPWFELRSRARCSRVYLLHMSLFSVLLIVGYLILRWRSDSSTGLLLGTGLVTAAALLRSGIVPVHCWMTDLFEKATFGSAILYVMPLTGVLAVMRLVLPIAPDGVLRSVALLSLLTAFYAAGMATIQREARRFFCYLFLSNASMVLVGIELVTTVGVTGSLCVWFSVGLSLAGFGICLRSVEARIGRVSLVDYHGLYDQMPSIAGFFLLTGLASIGFPGTIGFIAMELLIEGAVEVYPLVGSAIVIAAALNGISILNAYFRIFTGRRSTSTVSLSARPAERFAVVALSILILAGGFFPQFGVLNRYHAASELNARRNVPASSSTAEPSSETNKESL